METVAFIEKYWGKPGGAERATYQMFLTELAQMLGAPTPDPGTGGELGDYQFEGPVKSEAVFLSKHNKRIDLYKRNCFILEAKQSQLKEGEVLPPEQEVEPLEAITDLFGNVVGHHTAKGKRPPKYDRLMADARVHKTPPFLIVADIGRSFELYFDWAGNGRGYSFFPDSQNYRITLDQLEDEKVRDLLRAIWTDPASVDPRLKAAEVTRDIAVRLSRVATALENNQRQAKPGAADFELTMGIEETSLFLMRVLFCMFAEDVELLGKGSFTLFLEESRGKSDMWWQSGLRQLWQAMNNADEHNRFWTHGDALVRHFNGNLFSSAKVFDLPQEFKGELFEAAKRDWRAVEPAIFGTLLEQVLTTAQRAQLGAHYTPRPYVQRLVSATFGDLLNEEWETVEASARTAADQGDHSKAITLITDFHTRLYNLRILDPACGTGNFLYVSMEELLRLEGKAIALAESLGHPIAPAVHPNQFLGLELNPRAAVIAELVLWIGWLRHRLANHPSAIGDPVLPTLTNINGGTHGGFDAVLRRTATGEPDTANPLVPDWPKADFIVGNPPFIGGKDIRAKLGGEYAEALWKANPRVPKSADFVMQWWDHAAWLLTRPDTTLRRFGFVTTNSITQTFSRRVIEGYLHKSSTNSAPVIASEARQSSSAGATGLPRFARNDEGGSGGTLSLILAIPDHPWTKATPDAAAVRIAMTVAEAGAHDGTLLEIVHEEGLETDDPNLVTSEAGGAINADLTVGTDTVSVQPLKSNGAISSRGMMLFGAGFIVTPEQAVKLGLKTRKGLEKYVRPYMNGRDLLQRPRDMMAIDLYGLTEVEVRQKYPEIYQHVLATVKPERDRNRDRDLRDRWWQFGRPRTELRPALEGLNRYIGSAEIAKHRVFEFLDCGITPDNRIIVIASDDAYHLGVLSTTAHLQWSLSLGGTLEDRPSYSKSQCFDPFPFPDATPEQRAAIAELAEELDATRKAALAEVPGLTMTEIYNLVAWLKSSSPKSSPERGGGGAADGGGPGRGQGGVVAGLGPLRPVGAPPRSGEDLSDRARAARAGIVHRLHEQIDAAVADAYGWPADLTPSEIVTRLVALNAERAKEEAEGHIRWLRPDYQIPRFAR
jgi:hypothetical protein